VTDSEISHNVASSNGAGLSIFQGSLQLVRVVVDGNTGDSDGGGIDLYDTPTTIEDSRISNNVGGRDGGGINHYRNTLSLNNVTIDGNIAQTNAGDGGGIYNDPGTSGQLLIANSTLSRNSTTNHGGGIFNTTGSTLILTNTTLSANSAITGGALYNAESFSTDYTVMTLTNVTLKDNRAAWGGALVNENRPRNLVFAKNAILADSTGGNCRGKGITAPIYSLSTDLSCGLAGTGDLNNTPAQLSPLGSHGGPTLTHLPLPASPAVDAVQNNDCPLFDQRGVGRPQGPYCDMGAVERKSGDPVTIPWLWLPLIRR
jgi:polymorphic membrane protein